MFSITSSVKGVIPFQVPIALHITLEGNLGIAAGILSEVSPLNILNFSISPTFDIVLPDIVSNFFCNSLSDKGVIAKFPQYL